jgi:hypothetical protein
MMGGARDATWPTPPALRHAIDRIRALGGLDTEGLLRKTGEVGTCRRFARQLLEHEHLEGCGDVHVAASALKLWVLEQALLPVRGSPRLRLAHAAEAAALGARGTAHVEATRAASRAVRASDAPLPTALLPSGTMPPAHGWPRAFGSMGAPRWSVRWPSWIRAAAPS